MQISIAFEPAAEIFGQQSELRVCTAAATLSYRSYKT